MAKRKIRVLFAAFEAVPFMKTGGLGDVAGSLPKALLEAGIEARVMLPKFATIPEKCLYVDLLCVAEDAQGQGRGSRLIQAACRYADEVGLPIMLFTNGAEDIKFYQKNGFRIIGVTSSEKFGFENTYVLYEPKQQGCADE